MVQAKVEIAVITWIQFSGTISLSTAVSLPNNASKNDEHIYGILLLSTSLL